MARNKDYNFDQTKVIPVPLIARSCQLALNITSIIRSISCDVATPGEVRGFVISVTQWVNTESTEYYGCIGCRYWVIDKPACHSRLRSMCFLH